MPRDHEESAPLLGGSAAHNYAGVYPTAPPIGTEDSLPPDYAQATRLRRIVRCEVCGFRIDATNAHNVYEVTCQKCFEETPLGNPPKGKSYSRCAFSNCNNLLRFPSTATKVTCSRCKEIVDVSVQAHGKKFAQALKSATELPSTSSGGTLGPTGHAAPSFRFICGYCNVENVMDVAPGPQFRCRQCGKRSCTTVSNQRAIVSIVIGTALVVCVLALMAFTLALRHNSGYWWAYMIGLGLATFFNGHGLWLMCMKKSIVQIVP